MKQQSVKSKNKTCDKFKFFGELFFYFILCLWSLIYFLVYVFEFQLKKKTFFSSTFGFNLSILFLGIVLLFFSTNDILLRRTSFHGYLEIDFCEHSILFITLVLIRIIAGVTCLTLSLFRMFG